MKDYTTTRKCHHCGRHSWLVANGEPCAWCARRTPRHYLKYQWVVTLVALASLVSVAYIAVNL